MINDSPNSEENVIDEIKTYLDCHYISPYEAVWHLFEFPIHYRDPSIEKLIIHLANMNQIFFRPSDNISYITNNSYFVRTMFTEWIKINAMYPDIRCLPMQNF